MITRATGISERVRRLGLQHTGQLIAENVVAGALGDPARRRLRLRMSQAAHDRFDRIHGTDTSARASSVDEPTDARSFANILRLLDVDPARNDWVDIGCGKGRTVILAARAGFRRVLGVENHAPYMDLARRNVAAAIPEYAPRIELTLADIREWPLPESDAVLFAYNPFGANILNDLLVRCARPSAGRRIFVYYNAVHREVAEKLVAAGLFRVRTDQQLLYGDCLVLESTRSARETLRP